MSLTPPNVDPTLGRVPRVLVPVELDAMVLRSDTGGFADCLMREPQGTGLQQLLPPPFAELVSSDASPYILFVACPPPNRRLPPPWADPSNNEASP